MGRAKDIIIKVIPSKIAIPFVKKHHYSGKVVNKSCLHFGAFLTDLSTAFFLSALLLINQKS